MEFRVQKATRVWPQFPSLHAILQSKVLISEVDDKRMQLGDFKRKLVVTNLSPKACKMKQVR
jgi:hypothetical protein